MRKNNTIGYNSWFDTPFYHILYKDRDQIEAQTFMSHLINYLNLPKSSKILDLACGKGRHSIFLNNIGYEVTGIDLSIKSITHAKLFENKTLHFEVHDMSKPYNMQFDAVFNLFTSFGYFNNDEAHLKTIKAIKSNLNPKGHGVIDFMNTEFVIKHLIPQDIKTIETIDFHQKRYVKNGYLIKDISFNTENTDYKFQESVRAYTLSDFKKLFKAAGIELLDIFGDYKLNKFNKKTSPRLIMVFKSLRS